MKIGIIDEGIDQTHPFFDPRGFSMPAGFPKGQTAYTTAKVIVARAFPPPRPAWRHASKPFDPEFSSHGTHVAGIAAGNANTPAEGGRISGVAPRAYLGNYKVLTIPTDADVGLDGNSPQIVAAIEAAVADGMDVINLSLGEPEIEPSRDIVAEALDAAARAGVVPVVAAGNDFDQFGRGSVSSPGSTPEAITVGAVSTSRSGAPGDRRLVLLRRPDAALAPAEARGERSGRLDPLGEPRRDVRRALRHEHGGAARRRRRRSAAASAIQRGRRRRSSPRSRAPATVRSSTAAGTTEAPTTREGGGVVNLAERTSRCSFRVPSRSPSASLQQPVPRRGRSR